MDVKANEDVPLGVHHPPHPAHAVLSRALARQGLGWNERGRLCAHSDRIEPSSLDPWLFCAGRKKVLALGGGGVLSYVAFSGGLPKWPTGADCKSAGFAFLRSNRRPTTIFRPWPWLRPRAFLLPRSVPIVFPRRRFGVETLRAPSLPLVAPPLGFPRHRALNGGLEAWRRGRLALLVGFRPTPRLSF